MYHCVEYILYKYVDVAKFGEGTMSNSMVPASNLPPGHAQPHSASCRPWSGLSSALASCSRWTRWFCAFSWAGERTERGALQCTARGGARDRAVLCARLRVGERGLAAPMPMHEG